MFRSLLIALLLLPSLAGAQEVTGAPEAQKKAYFWLRMWPDFLVKYDIEKDEEVARIQTKNGVCHGTTYSHDDSQAFMITGKRSKVEVFDLLKNEVVEIHDFSETGWLNRVDGVREIPGGKKWYVNLDRVKLEPDRYKIERSQWLLYDVEKKEILKRMRELPTALRRGAQISPDGSKWHIFGRDLQVIDPESLEEVGKIDLSTPLYSGMGAISVSSRTDLFFGENPGRYRFLYTMTDPVRTNRRLGGIIELDLEEMKIANRIEWGSAPRSWRLYITRDGKRAIGTGSSGRGGGQGSGEDPIVTLVEYSLEDGSKTKETRIPSRNGLGLSGIAPDGSKLYFTGRGHELVIVDGDHQPLKTVELEGELEGSLHLVWQ